MSAPLDPGPGSADETQVLPHLLLHWLLHKLPALVRSKVSWAGGAGLLIVYWLVTQTGSSAAQNAARVWTAVQRDHTTPQGVAVQFRTEELVNDGESYTDKVHDGLKDQYDQHGIAVTYPNPLSAWTLWAQSTGQPAYTITIAISGEVLSTPDGAKKLSLKINSPFQSTMYRIYELDEFHQPKDLVKDLNTIVAANLQKRSDAASALNAIDLNGFYEQVGHVLEVSSLQRDEFCLLTEIRGRSASLLKQDAAAISFLKAAIAQGCARPVTHRAIAVTYQRLVQSDDNPLSRAEYHAQAASHFNNAFSPETDPRQKDNDEANFVAERWAHIWQLESIGITPDPTDLKNLQIVAREVLVSNHLNRPVRNAIQSIQWKVEERLEAAKEERRQQALEAAKKEKFAAADANEQVPPSRKPDMPATAPDNTVTPENASKRSRPVNSHHASARRKLVPLSSSYQSWSCDVLTAEVIDRQKVCIAPSRQTVVVRPAW